MSDGYPGDVTSATLYNTKTYKFTKKEDKLHIPAGVKVTITMKLDSATDTVTLSYTTGGSSEDSEETNGWYLWGSLVESETVYTDFGNSKDEWNKPTPYAFKNGKITTTFDTDAYVAVKYIDDTTTSENDNSKWYMSDGYPGNVTSATLYNTKSYKFTKKRG